MLCQATLQLGHGYTGLDGGRQIGGVVMHDAAQAREVEDLIEARGPVSNSDRFVCAMVAQSRATLAKSATNGQNRS